MTSARHGTVLRELQTLFTSGTTSGLTDSQLIQRFVTGHDDEAFAALVERHGPTVFAVCRGALRDRHDAEDAFQATFLILARKAQTIRAGESAGAWLHRVALRVAAQGNIEADRRALHEQRASVPEAREFGLEGPWDDLLPRLHEEIGRLPEKYRAPIVLCDLGSLTRDQAAGQLGWPPGTVAGRLARGRDLLRTRLIRRGVAPACVASATRSLQASIPEVLMSRTIEVVGRSVKGEAVSTPLGVLVQGAMKAMLRSQIRGAMTAALAIGVVTTGLFAAITLALAGPGPEPVVSVSGTVVDADGRPLPDAEVVLAEGPPPMLSRYPSNVRPSVITPAPAPPAVLQQGRSNAKGDFRLDGVERLRWVEFGNGRNLVLWIYRAGESLMPTRVPSRWPSNGAPLRVRAGRSERLTFKVLTPDGQPVVDAQLAPARVRGLPLPNEVAQAFATRTDATGSGALAGVVPGDLDVVRVTSGLFGIQQIRTPHPDPRGTRTLRLFPVGRVEGHFKAMDPNATRAIVVRIRTSLDVPEADAGVGGMAECLTDEHGRFSVPAIAAGRLDLAFKPHLDLPFRGPYREKPIVSAGATLQVEVPLTRAVHIRGLVREQKTGAPVVGTLVWIDRDAEIPPARTDARGQYEGYVPPGYHVVSFNPFAIGPYLYPRRSPDREPIPDGVREWTRRPLELVKGVALDGRVVDTAGKPVAGAEVSGTWTRGYGWLQAVSDRDGAFRIEGFDPDGEAKLVAQRGSAFSAHPVTALPGKGPVLLEISSARAVALAGRVVDAQDRPLSGAIARIIVRSPNSNSSMGRPIELDDDGAETLATGADGRFQTPRRFRPDLQYLAEVSADGRTLARSGWIEPSKTTTFVDIVLQPAPLIRSVKGRVVDAAGRPVVGASVSQSGDGPSRTRTTTDARGQFDLPGVFREPAFVFVEGQGLRFAGHRIDASDGPFDVKVRRIGDPDDAPMRTLSPKLSRADETRLALRLLESDLDRIARKTVEHNEMFLLSDVVPRLDPARARGLVELAEGLSESSPYWKSFFQLKVAQALADERPAEAIAIVEAIKSPTLRSRFYLDGSDSMPGSDRAHKLEWLELALRHARAESDPIERLSGFSSIAGRFLGLGERDRGTGLIRECQRLAEGLPKPDPNGSRSRLGEARIDLASRLARIDEAAALELAEGTNPPLDRGGIFMAVALGLSAQDPVKAEQVLSRVAHSLGRQEIAARIAGRVVTKDPEMARRLVEMIELPAWRVSALGMMAERLSESNSKAAIALVDEAFDRLLRDTNEGNHPESDMDSLAFAMLPLAERLDAELLRRCFWKTVSMRRPRTTGGEPNGRSEDRVARLALALARYDRDVARQILEPVANRSRSVNELTNLPDRGHILFAAAAAIDPAYAVALADALPEDSPGTILRPKALARRTIAEFLAYEVSVGWGRAWHHYFSHHLEDRED